MNESRKDNLVIIMNVITGNDIQMFVDMDVGRKHAIF